LIHRIAKINYDVTFSKIENLFFSNRIRQLSVFYFTVVKIHYRIISSALFATKRCEYFSAPIVVFDRSAIGMRNWWNSIATTTTTRMYTTTRSLLWLILLFIGTIGIVQCITDTQFISTTFRTTTNHYGGTTRSLPSFIARTNILWKIRGGNVGVISGESTNSKSSNNTSSTNNFPTTTTTNVAVPLSQTTTLDSVREAPLLEDIELLSELLSNLVNSEDATIHDLYEFFRLAGLERAIYPNSHSNSNNNEIKNVTPTIEPLQRMIDMASTITAEQAVGVMRTFSIMLNLVNSAEVTHRTRVTQQHELLLLSEQKQQQLQHGDTVQKMKSNTGDTRNFNNIGSTTGPLPLLDDSMRGTIDALVSSGVTSQQIYDQLLRQKVEIVLTAHPTQVQRKSLLRKYRQISETLQLRRTAIGYQQNVTTNQLARIISSIWGADEIRRSKPTPQQEAAGGNAVIETVLWDAIPAYIRKLHTQLAIQLNISLPIDCCPIKFGSWIGGDRDGNPNVTPEVTREVVLQQRLRAARLLTNDLYQLISELGISCRFSKELEELAATIPKSPHVLEKYRRVIGHLIDRLVKTSRDIEIELATIAKPENTSVRLSGFDEISSNWNDVEPIYDEEDLLRPLKVMHNSLVETGFELVADGLLVDIIRRVNVFGLSLVPLDIREESTKHTEALDAITRYLGIGSYKEWNEDARLNWLTSELSSKRPLFTDRDLEQRSAFDASVTKTIRTFATAATLRPSALGAYVISQAQTASDVLAVMLLQKQFGMTPSNGNMMRVVPLFETLNDLQNAPMVLETLFRIPFYIGAVKSKQEVMVGYSDSAKDAGRLAACWALYYSQEKMASVATKYGIELTFFHGKGGTVGRGGNPSVYRAIMSHPPNTINGRFRVTEQG
jgi:phosphoenolpyruvate carboxylase